MGFQGALNETPWPGPYPAWDPFPCRSSGLSAVDIPDGFGDSWAYPLDLR